MNMKISNGTYGNAPVAFAGRHEFRLLIPILSMLVVASLCGCGSTRVEVDDDGGSGEECNVAFPSVDKWWK